MYWDQLTSRELEGLKRKTPVILPISATEQHGAHLPLGTDRMIGDYFCRKINEEIPDEVLILPSLGIGCSAHHMDFAGSLTLTHTTFLSQMTEILQSVVYHGFTRLLILNSHGGNQGVGQVVVEAFGSHNPDTEIAFATWFRIASEALTPLNETGFGGVGHAGEFETSLMLEIAPELVNKKLMAKGKDQEGPEWAMGDLLRGPKASLYRSMKELTGNGVFGDPNAASAAKGVAITNIVVPELIRIIRDLEEM